MSDNQIKNKIVVLSGKGGVGKSTVSTNIAVSLSLKGYKVGLLDVDVHGPSIPTLLNLEDSQPISECDKIVPIDYNDNLKVISVGFMIEDLTAPIIWRGPAKSGFIKQMLTDVAWGELDYLIVDCPPGTGDEPLSIIQELGENTKTVIVTTPQKLSVVDVKKSINFCKKLNTNLLGVIENMSGFVCPHCKEVVEIFNIGGGEKMAKEMDVPFLGKIPMEIEIAQSGDSGKPFIEAYKDSETAKNISKIIDKL
ncbi:MAG: Mrp/NBP35 family ATP-binding protein [bacterium]|nr:Mrp/NBP35 family ATP-binding protein [bacterium]